jgi:hypothetical protein
LRLNIITRILLFTVGFFYCPNCLHFIEAETQYVIPEKFLSILDPGVWGFRCSTNLVNMINYVSRIYLNKFVLFLLMGKRKACQAYVASMIINRKAESNHCKSASRDPGNVCFDEASQTVGGKGINFWGKTESVFEG